MIPSKDFDAARTLEQMTLHASSAIVATAEQVAALESALANDAAKPSGKRQYNLSGLRGGLVESPTATPAKLGGVLLKGVAPGAVRGLGA